MLMPGRHRLRSGVAAALLLAVLSLGGSPWLRVCLGGTHLVAPDQVKAVYLYNFLHVVNWPGAGQVVEPSSAMVIGTLGVSPLNTALDELAASVRKRATAPIQVVHFGIYREGMDFRGCRILFISTSEKEHFKKITSSLKQASVLTVAESEGFLAAGGMIVLVEQQNRVRYRINRQATSAAGLRLSSQLLQSAISIEGE